MRQRNPPLAFDFDNDDAQIRRTDATLCPLPASEMPPVIPPEPPMQRCLSRAYRASKNFVFAYRRRKAACIEWAFAARAPPDDAEIERRDAARALRHGQLTRALLVVMRATVAVVFVLVVYSFYSWYTVDIDTLRRDARDAYADRGSVATDVNPFGFVRENDAGIDMHAASDPLECALLAFDRSPLPGTMGGPQAVSLASLRVRSAVALRGITDAVQRAHFETRGFNIDAHRCVCAPMYGARVRVISVPTLHDANGTVVNVEHMYNASLDADTDASAPLSTEHKWYTVREDRTHWMPVTYADEVRVRRLAVVRVRYVNTSCHAHTMTVRMQTAFCVQMCMDFIDGAL